MADDSPNDPLPHEMNWREFTARHPDFVEAINLGVVAIAELARDVPPTTVDGAVALLTGSIAENIIDVMFLFENERRDGAVRLLRTPFEKHLYADYLTKHPEKAEAFSLFWAVQSKQLLDGLKAHYGTEISEAGAEGMRKLLEIAKEKIEFNKCEACGSRLPRMWTKVTPEVMAKDAAMEETYFFAYRYATLLIHPTVMGIDHQLHNPPQLPNMLLHVRTIVMRTVVLQWEWFRKSKTVTGTAAVALNALSRAFAEPTTPLR